MDPQLCFYFRRLSTAGTKMRREVKKVSELKGEERWPLLRDVKQSSSRLDFCLKLNEYHSLVLVLVFSLAFGVENL